MPTVQAGAGGGRPTGRRKLDEVLVTLQQAGDVLQTEANFLANGCEGFNAADFERNPRLAPAAHVLETLQTHVDACAPLVPSREHRVSDPRRF